MSEFKIGDKVVCEDAEATGGSLKKGQVYTVGALNSFDNQISLEDLRGYWILSRFRLHEEAPAKFDIKTILKPFMRVITRSGRTWIVVTDSDNNLVLLCKSSSVYGYDWNTVKNIGEYSNSCYDIMEVYEQPDSAIKTLSFNCKGNLVWQHKSEKQLKIEALKKEIAELEASGV